MYVFAWFMIPALVFSSTGCYHFRQISVRTISGEEPCTKEESMCRNIGAFLVCFCLTFALTTPGFAGDRERKGRIVGVGIGLGMFAGRQHVVSSRYGTDRTYSREYRGSLLGDFNIGYAPTNQLAIYYMMHSSLYKFSAIQSRGDGDLWLSQTGGVGATYYLKPSAPSLLLVGGLGYSYSHDFYYPNDSLWGVGLTVGGGYEFVRHLSLQGLFSWGNPHTPNVKSGGTDGWATVDYFSIRMLLSFQGY
jgi:hypothetical protein